MYTYVILGLYSYLHIAWAAIYFKLSHNPQIMFSPCYGAAIFDAKWEHHIFMLHFIGLNNMEKI